MKYTAVFKWPKGEEPRVGKGDGWKGGELCAVSFSDALDEPDLCYDDKHRAAIVALWDALETIPNAGINRAAEGRPVDGVRELSQDTD
jgi:hypothetical protein